MYSRPQKLFIDYFRLKAGKQPRFFKYKRGRTLKADWFRRRKHLGWIEKSLQVAAWDFYFISQRKHRGLFIRVLDPVPSYLVKSRGFVSSLE